MPYDEYLDFARHLVHNLALPHLTRGYQELVRELEAARELLQLARAQGLDAAVSGHSAALEALRKGNKELVTAAEQRAEAAMREAVEGRYPEHAIVGEELGFRLGSRLRWVFDPVDGTSALVRTAIAQAAGLALAEPMPAFGVTVGLVDGDEAVVGVVLELLVQQDVLRAGSTWTGARGSPSLRDGHSARVNDVEKLEDAYLVCTAAAVMFKTPAQRAGYRALLGRARGLVEDQNCAGFMRLLDPASGIGVALEGDLAYHDVAALVPILTGAGALVTNDHGEPLAFPEAAIAREYRILAASPRLHAEALAVVREGASSAQEGGEEPPEGSRGYRRKFAD